MWCCAGTAVRSRRVVVAMRYASQRSNRDRGGGAFPNVGAIRFTASEPTLGNTLIRPGGAPSPAGRAHRNAGVADFFPGTNRANPDHSQGLPRWAGYF